MENEKKVQSTKAEVQKVNLIESGYPGITIREDLSFKRRSELTEEEIKKFNPVLCKFQTQFTQKANYEKDSINVKVYPFVDLKQNELFKYDDGKKGKIYSEYVVLYLDKKVKIERMEYLNLLLLLGKEPTLTDTITKVRRYARFITGIGINPKTKMKERYYRAQVFFSENCVKSFFFNKVTLDTMSALIKSGYIAPVTFIEPLEDDDDYVVENEEKKEE